MSLSAPAPLAAGHDVEAFDCGDAGLEAWLKRRALANQLSGATRTFVVCEESRAVAYSALTSGEVRTEQVTGRFRRNMPQPIPVVVLARLAVDIRRQGRGLGRALVADAAMRVEHAAEIIGVRGLVVHAISDDPRRFYLALGFDPSPHDPMTLLITLGDLRRALAPD